MGIKEKLEVIEAKLGIEPPDNSCPILVWDGETRLDGYLYPFREAEDFDNVSDYEHFVYLTPEIVAAINALPECKK